MNTEQQTQKITDALGVGQPKARVLLEVIRDDIAPVMLDELTEAQLVALALEADKTYEWMLAEHPATAAFIREQASA